MDFTEMELDALFTAWALHAKGKAMVPTDEAIPDCERLADAGWLSREERGDLLVFAWTPQSEARIDAATLRRLGSEGREN
jgi:hypothetical protein